MAVPPELRKRCHDTNIVGHEAAGKYGVHRLRMLKPRLFPGGVMVEVGDEIEVAGNVAAALIRGGKAESLDPRREKEEALIAEARRLGIPLIDADNPALNEELIERVRRRKPFVR